MKVDFVTCFDNTLMAMFLQNPSYTHLLFIDADIGFIPQDVVKLLHREIKILP